MDLLTGAVTADVLIQDVDRRGAFYSLNAAMCFAVSV